MGRVKILEGNVIREDKKYRSFATEKSNIRCLEILLKNWLSLYIPVDEALLRNVLISTDGWV